MAAKVFGKGNLLASLYDYHHDGRRKVDSDFVNSCSFRLFSSPKAKPIPGLRSQRGDFIHSEFYGSSVLLQGNQANLKRGKRRFSIAAQSGLIGKSHKWWEKGVQPNMKEVTSTKDLVDSLVNAGDKLVVVDFFSPGCGGCKALHPKMCQLAEQNPDVQFLQVNHEEHKSMCYSLHIHVLPFFRFYKGANGRVCSFSCTNATIKKFKDALAKYNVDTDSSVPAKGLEEKELIELAANKNLDFTYNPSEPLPAQVEFSNSDGNPPIDRSSTPLKSLKDVKEKSLVSAGR